MIGQYKSNRPSGKGGRRRGGRTEKVEGGVELSSPGGDVDCGQRKPIQRFMEMGDVCENRTSFVWKVGGPRTEILRGGGCKPLESGR